MATGINRHTVHGMNPQSIIGKFNEDRIRNSIYWKEHCTQLNSALILDKAVDDVRYIGGLYGEPGKPTPFLCLAFRLLQIQPVKEIIYLYIDQQDFKYLRALGAFYLRMVENSVEVYNKLEPMLRDYRKLRLLDRSKNFSVIHMDEFIDNLLRESEYLGVPLKMLTKRYVLEDLRYIKPYVSELELQNLIPMQLIEEKIEEAKRESNQRRHRDVDKPSRRRDDPKRPGDRHDRGKEDRHRDNRYRRDERKSDSRGATTSRRDNNPDISTTKSRFKQSDIDKENAIRAQVGLKPLR